MKFIWLFLLLFMPLLVKADQPRYRESFTSANDKYVFRKTPNMPANNWSVIEKATTKTLYEVVGWFYSFTVLVSDDGKNLVVIDDYSESKPEENPEVLQFYLDGKQIKSYKLSDLLENTKFISQSVSHFRWVRKPLTFSINGSKFNLTTYEFFNYDFDINTGETLKKKKTAFCPTVRFTFMATSAVQ